MTRRIALIVAVVLVIALAPAAASAQCAMCRRALDSPEGRQMIAALRAGILLLLAAPFSIFAAVATLAVRAQRRRLSGPPRQEPSALPSSAHGRRRGC